MNLVSTEFSNLIASLMNHNKNMDTKIIINKYQMLIVEIWMLISKVRTQQAMETKTQALQEDQNNSQEMISHPTQKEQE